MGTLDDIVVTIASWKYPIDSIIISPKKPRHPVVLRHPWLATADSVIGCQSGEIGCQSGEMVISNGSYNQTLSISSPAQIAAEVPLWLESPYGDEDCMFPLLSLEQSRGLQEQSEDHILQQFLSEHSYIDYLFLLLVINMFSMSFKKFLIQLYFSHLRQYRTSMSSLPNQLKSMKEKFCTLAMN